MNLQEGDNKLNTEDTNQLSYLPILWDDFVYNQDMTVPCIPDCNQ